MNPASPLFAVLSIGGSIVTIAGGLIVWIKVGPEIRKLSADARKVDVDAAVAEDAADDAHWKAIIAAQTEALVQPLREEVVQLRGDVASLRSEVELVRTRYWRAIAHIRGLLTWIHRTHPDSPGLPIPPAEIAADI